MLLRAIPEAPLPRPSMRRRVWVGLALLVMIAGFTPASAIAQEPPAEHFTHDVLVLLDTTASMTNDRGEGPLWPAVLASVTDLTDRLEPGTNVAVVPFDSGPRLARAYPPSTPPSVRTVAIGPGVVAGLQSHLVALPTDGQETHIYESLEFALGELERWRDETPGNIRVQTLVLYTDGEDNGPRRDQGVGALAGLLDQAQRTSTSLAIVYHDVATLLSEPDRQALEAVGVQVVSLQLTPLVAIETASIDLGQVAAGDSVAAELRLTSAFADVFGRRVEASVVGPEGITLTGFSPILSTTMPFEVTFEGPPAAGDHQVELVLRSSVDGDFSIVARGRVTLRFRVVTPPPVPPVLTEPEPLQPSALSAPPLSGAAGPGTPLVAIVAAVLGLGVVLVGVVLAKRRRPASDTTFHRLLMRNGGEPSSLLDREALLVVLLPDDLEHRDPHDGDPGRGSPNPDLAPVLRHAALTLRSGELYVRPLNLPLFIGTELVPAKGRQLRSGEFLRVGALHVRYDRCEVKS